MHDKMKEMILWIGPLLDEPELEEMVKNGECATASANLAEWNFLKYFVQETQCDLVALSAIRTIEWPKNKKLYYRDKPIETYFDGRLKLHNVGFCNIFGISHLARGNALIAKARELASSLSDDTFVNLFVYSMHLPFMKAAEAFKAHHSNCCYKLIVPDLPLNMNTSTRLRKVLKEIDWRNIQNGFNAVDGFILYTRQMADYLKIRPNRFIVCEGIANLSLLKKRVSHSTSSSSKCRTLLYAGNLDAKYRMENLVKAFGMVNDPGTELIVYGKGSGSHEVEVACSEVHNATFGGFKPNDEITSLMLDAYCVVNPRPIDIDCAEYSCPSKTLEAMACGVAFASSRLPGIPNEYWDYIYELDCTDSSHLANSLCALLSMSADDIRLMGEKASNYIEARSRASITTMLSFRGDKNE